MKIQLISVALFLLPVLLMPVAGLALESYNGYGGYVIGDHRIIGQAGAYLAKSNDLNAVNYNPAGLIFSPAVLDVGIGQSKIDNSQTDFDHNGSKDSFPLTYWFSGIISRTHRAGSCYNIALGLVYNNPYAAEQKFDGKVLSATTLEKYNLKLAINSFTIPVAFQLSNDLAIGANINNYSVEEDIRLKFPVYFPGTSTVFDQVDIDDEQEVTGTSVDLGILYRPTENLSLGVVFKPEITFNFNEQKFFGQLTQQDTGIQWYRSVSLPVRAGIGANYEFSRKCAVSLDTNYIGPQNNTVMVGSELVSGMENYEFKDTGVYDLHLGGTYLWQVTRDLQLDWRAGTYYEPSRVRKLDSRWHYTGGLQINWLYLMVGFGYDKAVDYKNLVTVVALMIRR
jgi:long-subunit fatty acid transport protein